MDSDNDADAPRVAQWEDDIDEQWDVHESREEKSNQADDIRQLPLGALRKAQRILSEGSGGSDSGGESAGSGWASNSEAGDDDLAPEQSSSALKKGKHPEKVKTIERRSNKHAPVEMSSKRAVTRRRAVVDLHKKVSRDPRALPLAGDFSAKAFHKNYAFLSEMHTSELTTLKADLKRAKKLLISSPRDLREEREAEVKRLELAVKRAESMVNRDRREKVESDALDKVMKEERERQKHGKRSWYMKNSDKKELLLKARYDSLAESGGKLAVKKAIEKKRKKLGQKEKRSRPFAASSVPRAQGAKSGDMFSEPSRPHKKRKVEK